MGNLPTNSRVMTKLIEIQVEIARLQKQANEIRNKEFEATVIEIKSKMHAYGITIKDLMLPVKANRKQKALSQKKKVTTPVSAKYRGPNGETWSGRGLMPKWLSAYVASGKSKDDFLIGAVNAVGSEVQA